MRKVVASPFTSLDGFMSGPNGEIEWNVPYFDEEMASFVTEGNRPALRQTCYYEFVCKERVSLIAMTYTSGTSSYDALLRVGSPPGQKRKRKMREVLSLLLCYTGPYRAQTSYT
jgi:hypothetical protein